MNKFLLSVTIGCTLTLGVYAQNRGVNFKHDAPFKEVLDEAKKQNKLIFFDAYTSWCGPCKMMATQVFTIDSIGDFFNQNFVNVKYDMEKGEGVELKKRFKDDVKAFPTFLFINGDGQVVHKIVGAAPAKEFMPLARQVMNPSLRLSDLTKKYNAGDHSAETITAYLNALDNGGDNATMLKVAKNYLDALPQPELLKPENWSLISKYLKSVDSKTFNYVLSHKEQFIISFGVLKVNSYLNKSLQNEVGSVSSPYFSGKPIDRKREANLISILSANPYEGSNSLYTQALLNKYRSEGNWTDYTKLIDKVIYTDDVVKGAGKISYTLSYAKTLVEKAPATYLPKAMSWIDELSKYNLNSNFLMELFKFKKTVLEKQGKTELISAVDTQIESLAKKAEEDTKKGAGGMIMMKSH